MENEIEDVSLVDVWDEEISRAFNRLAEAEPGTDEYTIIKQDLMDLMNTKIRYTEVILKYEDSEAQRAHEKDLKRMECDDRIADLESQLKNQRNSLVTQVGISVIDGVLKNIAPQILRNLAVGQVGKMEAMGEAYFQTAAWRLLQSGR